MAEAVSGTSKVPWDLRDLKYQGKQRLQKLGDSELRALCEERGITLEQDHTREDYVRALLAWKALRSAAVSVTKTAFLLFFFLLQPTPSIPHQ